MGLSAIQKERLREIAREAKEIVGGCLHPDGRSMTFAELEDECIQAGDLVTSAMLEEAWRSLSTTVVSDLTWLEARVAWPLRGSWRVDSRPATRQTRRFLES